MPPSLKFYALLEKGFKICSRCKDEKSLDNYSRRGVDKYRTTCKKCDATLNKIYETTQREKINHNRRERRKDPERYLLLSQRDSQRRLFKNKAKTYKSSKVILDWMGADLHFVKNHIESQFKEGMNWSNRGCGEGRWQLDHKIPISLTNTEDGKIVDNNMNRKIWHYTNLQPLWQIENAIKSNKY